jgi:hypothetical protein
MNKKIISVMAIILVLIVACGSYMLFFNGPNYKNITMNGITMEVPDNNKTVTQQTDIYSFYNDTDNNIEIFVLDTTEFGLSDMSEAFTFAALREMFQVGAVQQNTDGFNYNYSETTKVYSYVGNYTHKNILIVTGNKDDLIHILQTINVEEQITLNDTNETNVTEVQPKTTSKKTESKNYEKQSEEEINYELDPDKYYEYVEENYPSYDESGYDSYDSYDSEYVQ